MNFAKKSLGQNFLSDKNIIKKIISLTEIKNKNIIEIGSGKGALTEEILSRKPRSLTLIEKDFFLAEELKKKFSKNKLVKIYNEDILKFNFGIFNKFDYKIFGNLPYNISSQILVKIIKFNNLNFTIKNIVFMFQKELGEKIISKFPSKKYSRISILTNYKLKILKKFLVSPNCFSPKPKIDSMVIHFQPKYIARYKIKDINNLEKITNILFSNKRKMINKNIKKILNIDEIKKLSRLKTNLRPADISPDLYYKITELFEKK
jgi:16S rRNA (adenine1518-N6/adenine1519-N6)-dimethyltransferase